MCCRNVKAVLEAAGSGVARVVRVGVSVCFCFLLLAFLLGLGFKIEERGEFGKGVSFPILGFQAKTGRMR